MEKKIEKVFGSWDLEVGSFCYMVVYVEREELTNFQKKVKLHTFIHSRLQALFVGNIVQLEPSA